MTTINFNPNGAVVSAPGTPLLLNPATGNIGIITPTPSATVSMDGSSARTIQIERAASGGGNPLTIRAGGGASGGTNAAGGDLVLTPGVSTGNGRAWTRIQGVASGTAGTSDNAVVDTVINGMVILANGSATSIVDSNVSLGGQFSGGSIIYTISANDGTNSQVESGMVHFVGALVGLTYSTQIVKTPGASLATTGSLNVSWSTTTTVGTKYTVQVTATSAGLVSPTLVAHYVIVNNSGVATAVY